jgi:Zn-dependent protease/CBS domain-containing protein
VTNAGITFGRVFGIRLVVSPSWFLVFGLVTYSLAALYFPAQYRGWPTAHYWGIALSTSLLFFASVLLHELAHSLVALRFRIPVRSITLFIFGGVSHIAHDARSPRVEFLIALAGPVTSLLLGVLGAAGYWLLQTRSEPAAAACFWLAGVNVSLGLFNLLPAFPLDGGRLLRSMIWCAGDDFPWATRVAARAGQGAAICLIGTGAYLVAIDRQQPVGNGLWLILIGWFLIQAAARTLTSTLLLHELEGVVARDVMQTNPPLVIAEQPLSDLATLLLANPRSDPAVVLRDGRAVGLVGSPALSRVGAERRVGTPLSAVMQVLTEEQLLAEELPAAQALQTLVESGNEALPVCAQGRVVGLLRRDDLLRLVALRRRLRSR